MVHTYIIDKQVFNAKVLEDKAKKGKNSRMFDPVFQCYFAGSSSVVCITISILSSACKLGSNAVKYLIYSHLDF